MFLAQRASTPEILDGENFTREELRENLRDMERYSRLAGGLAGVRRALESLAPETGAGGPSACLEIGAGTAGMARGLARGLAGARPALVVAGDLSEEIAALAREGAGGDRSVRLCVQDARALPHPDGAFDLAWSSLLAHHLDEDGLVAALAEMKRVTRVGFVLSDLRRSPVALAAVWALTRLTSRNRITLHDGPLSVRRAYTVEEMRGLARRAGLESPGGRGREAWRAAGGFIVRRSGPARLVLIYRHAPSRLSRRRARPGIQCPPPPRETGSRKAP